MKFRLGDIISSWQPICSLVEIMVANKGMVLRVARWLSTGGLFGDDRISRPVLIGSISIATLLGALQTIACSDRSVNYEMAAANKTEMPSLPPVVEIRSGPVMVPVPEGDTEVFPLKPLPAGTGPGVPRAIVPGVSLNVAPAPTRLNASESTSVR